MIATEGVPCESSSASIGLNKRSPPLRPPFSSIHHKRSCWSTRRISDLENPLFVPPVSKQTFEEFRRAMLDAGKEVLDKTAALVPIDGVSVRRVCEIGTPAGVLLDAAETTGADLVVVGARGLGRLHEWFLDSVSTESSPMRLAQRSS